MLKLRWLDDSDHTYVADRLRVAKNKLSDWEWVRWEEYRYPTPAAAVEGLICSLFTSSMFAKGKVVYSYGVPKDQSSLSEKIGSIPDGSMLILIGRPDKKTKLYKEAMKLSKKAPSDYKIDAYKPLDGRSAAKFVEDRSKELGLESNELCSKMVAEIVGYNPGRISTELMKAKEVSLDGKLHRWIVEGYMYGDGEADTREMCSCIVKGRADVAHEFLSRLLSRGECPIRICGYLMEWIRRMAIAESRGGDYDSIKPVASELKKYKASDKRKMSRDMTKLARELTEETVESKIKKIKSSVSDLLSKRGGETVPMYPNVGALYYSCKDYSEARDKAWTLGIELLYSAQMRIRNGEDPGRVLHAWIGEMTNTEVDA